MRQIIPGFIACMLLTTTGTLAQPATSALDDVAYTVISCLRSGYDERILLETDKKVYGAGENIWFSAYVLHAVNNTINTRSRVLFADIVDARDSVVTQQLLHAGRLMTNGALVLPDSLPEGHYWIRAYTRHTMRNDPTAVAVLPVYVINKKTAGAYNLPVNKTPVDTSLTLTTPVLQLFPEGGKLVSGMECAVAVRVTNAAGRPLQSKGMIKDRNGKTVTHFNTGDHGLGKFTISPTLRGKYSAWLFNGVGYDSILNLPPIDPYAAQISVQQMNGYTIKVRVLLEDSLFTPDYTTYIAGISRDSLCFASIGRGMYELNIPVDAFPAGVAHLLLFNAQQRLLSARDVYIPNRKYQLSMVTDKPFYSGRQEVKADFVVTDAKGKPLAAELSVAVTDVRISDSVNTFYTDSLALLPAETIGLELMARVPPIITTLQQCDTTRSRIPVQAGDALAISGTLYNSKKQPLAAHEVVVMSSEGAMFVMQDTTDMNGHFQILLPDFYDSTRFSIQVNNMNREKVDYVFVQDAYRPIFFATPAGMKENYYARQAAFVQDMKRQYTDTLITAAGKGWLPPVTVSADKKKKKVVPVKNPTIITQEMLKKGGFNNVGEAVLRSGKFHLVQNYLMSGAPNGFAPAPSDEPIVVLDGIPITIPTDDQTEVSPVLAYLKTITISEVGYIKLLTGTEGGFYGVRGGHGVIEIYTTSKQTDYSASAKGLNSVYPKGYHVPPVFSMPDYTNDDTRYAENNPDLRTTISWHAGLFTDANGKASIRFYTADARTEYLVRVTGITATGEIIFNTFRIKRP